MGNSSRIGGFSIVTFNFLSVMDTCCSFMIMQAPPADYLVIATHSRSPSKTARTKVHHCPLFPKFLKVIFNDRQSRLDSWGHPSTPELMGSAGRFLDISDPEPRFPVDVPIFSRPLKPQCH